MYLKKNKEAVRNFLLQCASVKADVRRAALPACDITYYGHFLDFPRMRQIRKVKNTLAEAFEPELGNWIVLTANREVLSLTPEELKNY